MPNIFERAREKREREGEAAVKGGEAPGDGTGAAPAAAPFDFFRVPKVDPEKEAAKKKALLELLRGR